MKEEDTLIRAASELTRVVWEFCDPEAYYYCNWLGFCLITTFLSALLLSFCRCAFFVLCF